MAALVLNAAIWGLAWWPFRELEGRGLHALWATALVYTCSLVGLSCVKPLAGANLFKHPELWLLVVASGLTNVGFNWGITEGDVVRVVLLFYLMPAWATLLAWWLLNERPTRGALLRVGLALVGVACVVLPAHTLGGAVGLAGAGTAPAPHSLLADALGVLGGASFALTNVMLRRLVHVPSESRTFAMFFGGAACAAAVGAVLTATGQVAVPSAPAAWWPLALGLSVWFLVGNLALQYGASRLAARTTALVLLTEVLFAAGSSVALGASNPSGWMLLGAALILGAALLAVFEAPTAH